MKAFVINQPFRYEPILFPCAVSYKEDDYFQWPEEKFLEELTSKRREAVLKEISVTLDDQKPLIYSLQIKI